MMLINGRWFPFFAFDKDEGDGAGAGGEGGAGATPAGEAGGSSSATDDAPNDLEGYKALVKKFRLMEKDYDKLRKDEEKRQRETMTETERLKQEKLDAEKRMSEVMAKANEKLARASVIAAAAVAGFNDPSDAWSMIREGLEIGDDGEVTNLDRALAKLAKDKPYLLKSSGATPPGEGKGNGAPPPAKPPSPGNTGGGAKLTRDDLKKMSPQEYAKRKKTDKNFEGEVAEALRAD